MADIHQIVSLGIGTPADIEHFVLVGLNANPVTTDLPSYTYTATWQATATYTATWQTTATYESEWD